MFDRIAQVFRKELIQTFRDPQLRGLLFAPAIVNVLLFGYAISSDVRDVATAINDQDNTATSRKLVAAFVASGYFTTVAVIDDDLEADSMIDSGRAAAVLHINKGFEESIQRGETAEVQLILDGSDSNTASVVLSYGTAIVQQFSANELKSGFSSLPSGVRQPQVTVRSRALFNENLQSRDYFLSGVMATTMLLTTLTLTGLGVVREREIGTIEQVMVSPITPLEYAIGKMAPFGLMGLGNLVIMLALGVLLFDVPVRGHLLWIFLPALLYVTTAVGLGFLISTFSTTQQEAMISVFFVYILLLFFSGFIYPVSSMPEVVQVLVKVNPMAHFVAIVRGVLLKGVGPEVFWPHILWLAVIGVITIGWATIRFRKTYA